MDIRWLLVSLVIIVTLPSLSHALQITCIKDGKAVECKEPHTVECFTTSSSYQAGISCVKVSER